MPMVVARRRFLQTAAGAVAGSKSILLANPAIGAGSQDTPPSDRLRFAIVGIGMQGSGLLQNALTLPGMGCVGAADLYDGRHTLAKQITGNENLPTTRRYHDLLERKDIPGHEPMSESTVFEGKDWDDVRPHLWNFFQAVRTRKPVTEDAVFGNHAAIALPLGERILFRFTSIPSGTPPRHSRPRYSSSLTQIFRKLSGLLLSPCACSLIGALV